MASRPLLDIRKICQVWRPKDINLPAIKQLHSVRRNNAVRSNWCSQIHAQWCSLYCLCWNLWTPGICTGFECALANMCECQDLGRSFVHLCKTTHAYMQVNMGIYLVCSVHTYVHLGTREPGKSCLQKISWMSPYHFFKKTLWSSLSYHSAADAAWACTETREDVVSTHIAVLRSGQAANGIPRVQTHEQIAAAPTHRTSTTSTGKMRAVQNLEIYALQACAYITAMHHTVNNLVICLWREDLSSGKTKECKLRTALTDTAGKNENVPVKKRETKPAHPRESPSSTCKTLMPTPVSHIIFLFSI